MPSSKELQIDSPGAASTVSRSNAPPATPTAKISGVAKSSPSRSPGVRTPGMNASPGSLRGSPLRKTMLDEKSDPWETEEILRGLQTKEDFRKKIGTYLKRRKPLYTEAM